MSLPPTGGTQNNSLPLTILPSLTLPSHIVPVSSARPGMRAECSGVWGFAVAMSRAEALLTGFNFFCVACPARQRARPRALLERGHLSSVLGLILVARALPGSHALGAGDGDHRSHKQLSQAMAARRRQNPSSTSSKACRNHASRHDFCWFACTRLVRVITQHS